MLRMKLDVIITNIDLVAEFWILLRASYYTIVKKINFDLIVQADSWGGIVLVM